MHLLLGSMISRTTLHVLVGGVLLSTLGSSCLLYVSVNTAPKDARTLSASTPSTFKISGLDPSRVTVFTGSDAAATSPPSISLTTALAPLVRASSFFAYEKWFSSATPAVRGADSVFTNLFNDRMGRSSAASAKIGTTMYFMGGAQGNGVFRNDVWSFETTTQTWALLKADNNAGVGVGDVDYPRYRQYHAMAAIGTKLYVVGGKDDVPISHNDVWSFDIDTLVWARVKADDNAGAGVVGVNYPSRRHGHTLAAVGTKLYLLAGYDTTYRNDVWSFDVGTSTWALVKAENNAGAGVVDVDFPEARYFHAMVEIGTKLYVMGGVNGGPLRNDVWSFETTTNTWARLKADDNGGVGVVDVNFPKRRYTHTMSAIGTKLFVMAGNDGGTFCNDVWSYETTTNTWALRKADNNGGVGAVDVQYPKKRYAPVMTAIGNSLYMTGGYNNILYSNDMWSFDTTTDSWTLLKNDPNTAAGVVDVDHPKGRDYHALTSIGSKLYVMGGRNTGAVSRNDVWSFDLDTAAWSLLKADDNAGVGAVNVNYPKKRYYHTMTAIGAKLYVFGGLDSGNVERNDVWSFDTSSGVWALLKADDNGGAGVVDVNYPRRRYATILTTIGTKLYLIGGLDSAGASRNDVWSFETNTNTWALEKADDNAGAGAVDVNYPRRRRMHGTAAISNNLYLLGGVDSAGTYRNDVWAFDVGTTSWSLLRANDNGGAGVVDVNYPKRRVFSATAAIGTKLYTVGGRDSTSAWRNDVWTFDSVLNTWGLIKADNNAGVGVSPIDYPMGRASFLATSTGSKLYVVGGMDAYGEWLNDVWAIDPSSRSTGSAQELLLAIDLTPSTGAISSAENISISMNAWAQGDNLGIATKNLHVYAWDDRSGAFVDLDSNTASSRALGAFTLSIDPGYRTSTNKLYLLLKSNYGRGAGSGSIVDLDFSGLSLTVPYQP